MLKKIILCFYSLMLISNIQSQTHSVPTDSIKMTDAQLQNLAKMAITMQYPTTRMLNITYDHSFKRDYNAEYKNQNFHKGDLENQRLLSVATNLPLFKTKKWSLSSSFKYLMHNFDFGSLTQVGNIVVDEDEKILKHQFSGSLNSTYFSLRAKKPRIYNTSIFVDGSNNGFGRVSGIFSFAVLMKATARVKMSLGTVLSIDPVGIPFYVLPLPIFTYNIKSKNYKWEFDAIIPQGVNAKYYAFKNGRFILGTKLGGTNFYINPSSLPKNYIYNQLEIRSSLGYEHKLTKSIFVAAEAGVVNFINSGLRKKGQRNNDFIYKNKQNLTGYFNIGISFNPNKAASKNK